MRIVIEPDQVTFGDIAFTQRPPLSQVAEILGSYRERRKGGAYLPTAIFDEMGIVARFIDETKLICLVDIHFATSRQDFEPVHPFGGKVILNGQELSRPVLLKTLKQRGSFDFDDKPTAAAGGKRIGVSLVPKFEYLGILNFGWKEVPSNAAQ